MKKVDLFLLKLFLCGILPVLLLAVFSSSYDDALLAFADDFTKFLYDFSGFVFALWMILSIYLGFRLMISETFREKVLSKLTFIKERDEREIMLTGKAAKTTMLTTISILLMLFCLSCFQVSIYSLPPEKAIDEKSNVISLGFNFKLLENEKRDPSVESSLKRNILEYSGLPLSSSAIIVGLIAWEIFSYNYSMRRFTK